MPKTSKHGGGTVNGAAAPDAKADEGITALGDVNISGQLKINGVPVTGKTGTVNTVTIGGQFKSGHDALYAYPSNMQSNGSLTTMNTSDVGMPRWVLDDTQQRFCKWIWAIPAAWDQVAARFAWNKEAAASGNVKWRFAYTLFYPFAGGDVNARAVDATIDLGAIAVPSSQYAITYQLNFAETINIADGAFGSKPFMVCSLSRVGTDATDTYNGSSVGVSVATLTRTI